MGRDVNWGRYKWQLQMDGHWHDYDDQEDLVLKQGYEKGQNTVRYDTRGNTYEVSFKSMTQLNIETKKVRRVRHKNVPAAKSGGKGAAKGGVKPASAPVSKPMDASAPKPEPKKGCCPSCKCCCGKGTLCACCIGLPILGAVVIMLVGGGVPDSMDEFGEMAMETADAIADLAEDAGEAIVDGVEDLIEHIT